MTSTEELRRTLRWAACLLAGIVVVLALVFMALVSVNAARDQADLRQARQQVAKLETQTDAEIVRQRAEIASQQGRIVQLQRELAAAKATPAPSPRGAAPPDLPPTAAAPYPSCTPIVYRTVCVGE
jgi:hypothetical protein